MPAFSGAIGRRFSSLCHYAPIGAGSVARYTGGYLSAVNELGGMLSGGFSSARRSFGQQSCDLHQVVGEHGGCDPQLKALATFGEATLHATAAEEHRDAPLDARAKALAVLELPALLIGFALGR